MVKPLLPRGCDCDPLAYAGHCKTRKEEKGPLFYVPGCMVGARRNRIIEQSEAGRMFVN